MGRMAVRSNQDETMLGTDNSGKSTRVQFERQSDTQSSTRGDEGGVSEAMKNWIDELNFLGIEPAVSDLRLLLGRCPDSGHAEAVKVCLRVRPSAFDAF